MFLLQITRAIFDVGLFGHFYETMLEDLTNLFVHLKLKRRYHFYNIKLKKSSFSLAQLIDCIWCIIVGSNGFENINCS